MSSGLALQSESEPSAIVACTVSRNVHRFDLLIEDMEAELGEGWGDLGFDEARAFLGQPEADELVFIALAITTDDEADVGMLGELIRTAKLRGTRVIIVADSVSPGTLHQLLKLGGRRLPALIRCRMARFTMPSSGSGNSPPTPRRARQGAEGPVTAKPTMGGQGRDLRGSEPRGRHGGRRRWPLTSPGNWPISTRKKAPSVCLIDFDLQFGTVATYLDLPRREIVLEFLQEAETMDVDSFRQALVTYGDKLSVFTSPPEIVPLDIMSANELNAILDLAQQCFDIVIVEMPRTLVVWSEAVLNPRRHLLRHAGA